MQKSRMKLHPFYEVAENAKNKMDEGAEVFQQWNCAHCGSKQQMPDPGVFYKLGICEECKKTTDIETDGCNFCAVYTINPLAKKILWEEAKKKDVK